MVSRTLSATDAMNDEERIPLLNVLFCTIVSVLFFILFFETYSIQQYTCRNCLPLRRLLVILRTKSINLHSLWYIYFFSCISHLNAQIFFFLLRSLYSICSTTLRERMTTNSWDVVNIIVTLCFLFFFFNVVGFIVIARSSKRIYHRTTVPIYGS